MTSCISRPIMRNTRPFQSRSNRPSAENTSSCLREQQNALDDENTFELSPIRHRFHGSSISRSNEPIEEQHDKQQGECFDHGVKVPLGKLEVKYLPYKADTVARVIAILCCIFAFVIIGENGYSWSLGVTNQLIVIGFLLSILNACLNVVAPTVFMQLEARMGNPTLQNYDVILRKTAFSSLTDVWWRVSLTLLAVLHLASSVAYKLFVGGTSSYTIDDIPDTSFGMYAIPGMQRLGATGVALLYNASLPYIQASSPNISALPSLQAWGDPRYEPPFPKFPRAYGTNILLLNKTTSASLDASALSFIAKVQSRLQEDESWNVTVDVLGTVAYYNRTIGDHPYEAYYDVVGNCWVSYRNQSSDFWGYYNGTGWLHWEAIYSKFRLYNFGSRTTRKFSVQL